MKTGWCRRNVWMIVAAVLAPLPSWPAAAQQVPQAPASPLVPPASTSPLVPAAPPSPLVPAAPGSISARTNPPPPPQIQTTPAPPIPPGHPAPGTHPGNASREELWRERRQGEFQQWRAAEDSPSTISCTQAGQVIIAVENAYDVSVDNSGAWPTVNFRTGYAGPTRAIGLNSPTLACVTRFGGTQGGLNQQTGSTGGADIYTLTCFRKGAMIAQQRVSNLNMSWTASKMTMSYHLRDGQETTSSTTFDVTGAACLVEPAGQEVVPVTAQLQ